MLAGSKYIYMDVMGFRKIVDCAAFKLSIKAGH